jgi:hypothetical protein
MEYTPVYSVYTWVHLYPGVAGMTRFELVEDVVMTHLLLIISQAHSAKLCDIPSLHKLRRPTN